MHAPSLHKWHLVELSSAFIAHHQKLAAALVILMSIVLASIVAEQFEILRPQTEQTISSTRLMNLPVGREFFERTSYISDSFGVLLEELPATRVSLAVYENALAEVGQSAEAQVGFVFEMDGGVSGIDFSPVQGISRRSWLNIIGPHSGTLTAFKQAIQSYDLELYDESGIAIAHLALRLPEKAAPLKKEEELLRIQHVAESLKIALLSPLESLERAGKPE